MCCYFILLYQNCHSIRTKIGAIKARTGRETDTGDREKNRIEKHCRNRAAVTKA